MNAIQMFEYILSLGNISSTYKYALLTSIVDYVIENPLEPPKNNFHFIPLFFLAKQYLAYYFPLVLEDVPQGPEIEDKNSIALITLIENFQKLEDNQKSLKFDVEVENTNLLYSFIEDSEELPKSIIRLLFEIRRKIIDQPLQYIRNVKGKIVSLFGLLSSKDPIQSDFEEHRKTGKQLKLHEVNKVSNWNELLENENLHIFFGHQTFQEISEFRFWLRDVIIKRWAQECIDSYKATYPNILSLFDLWKITPKRDNAKINTYKSFYQENSLQNCLYCNQKLEKDIILDHLFPWSRFPINSFWNLYPSCKNCNSKKSDKIPIIDEDLDKRITNHLTICLDYNGEKTTLIENDLKYLYRTKFKTKLEKQQKMQIEEISEYIRTLSVNLLEAFPGNEFSINNKQ